MTNNRYSANQNPQHLFKFIVILTALALTGLVGYFSGMGGEVFTAFQHLDGRRAFTRTEGSKIRRSLSTAKAQEFEHATVCADHPKCSKAGARLLEAGGHAVDAAIATALCLGVVNPQSSGIGGGGFMIIYDEKKHSSSAINFRETPARKEQTHSLEDLQHLLHMWKIEEAQYKVPTEGLFIGIPGELRGFELAWKKYGKLPWKDLFQPAIKLAREGFKVNKHLATGIKKNAQNITSSPGLRELLKPNWQFVKVGDIIRRKKYADTLEKIANSGGADIFYTGKMAETIVKDINSVGGTMAMDDLKEYRAKRVPPLQATLPNMKGMKLLAVPPPAGGAALLQIMNILSGYNFTADDMKKHPIRTYHRILEAFKFTGARLTYLTDPAFNKIAQSKQNEFIEKMLDSADGDKLRNKIDDVTHKAKYYGPINYHIDVTDGTTHLSVMDKDGCAVSLTTSINKYFGAKLRSLDLGIIYNDQLFDSYNPWINEFRLEPDALLPQKRPMSLASPCIILDKDDKVNMVIGAAGGRYIATALAQVLMNYYWFGDNLEQAVARPRMHHQLLPEMALMETTFPRKYIKGLKKYGHTYITFDSALITGTPDQIMGVVQVIVREKNGKLLALADHRKGGTAAGF